MSYSPILTGVKRNARLEKMSNERKDHFLPQWDALAEDIYFGSILLDNSASDREAEEKIYGHVF